MLESQTAPEDIQRLVDDRYKVSIEDQYLIVSGIPYVRAGGVVDYGDLISPYAQQNGVSVVGTDHTVWFTGSVPYSASGTSLQDMLVADTIAQTIAGRSVLCRLSNKPDPIGDMLKDFHCKMLHYIRKLSSHAFVLDPSSSARGSGGFHFKQSPSMFHYPNSAIARAGLDSYVSKLVLQKVCIVGLGGTGSYILDAIAKTPIWNIHLFDDDVIESHNPFRTPGAMQVEVVQASPRKTDYLKDLYSNLRTGVHSHPFKIENENLAALDDSDFVFLSVDDGPSRGLIANYLVSKGIPFIDVGIGVEKIPESTRLQARVRTTYVGGGNQEVANTLPVLDDRDEAEYNNIQLVELNALNAMLAVIRFKQHVGFYCLENELPVSRYVVSWNQLIGS